MDILSTLKGEYSRTLILILIPGGIALLPIADIFYVLFFKDQKEYHFDVQDEKTGYSEGKYLISFFRATVGWCC
jgi:hypothetical protein